MNHSIDIEGIGAELLGPRHQPPRRHRAGRVCAHDRCRTVLSVYNDRPMCARHDFCPDELRVHELNSQSEHTWSPVVRSKRAA
ncbi:MAG TPA: hypothetical protein VKU86_11780 [Acidimicrobiales bacterium]|nr:hypothetical protein [Acidimicrobiales bacterium]